MARYIDAEQFRGKHEVAEVNGKLSSVILYADIVYAPTADVVPRSEVEKIFEEIEGCFMFGECIYSISKTTYAELKKKYTGGAE